MSALFRNANPQASITMPLSTVETTDAIDTPYTSRLLHFDSQLMQTSALLVTMRAFLPYLTAAESASLDLIIRSTESLHADTSQEFKDLLRSAEILIQYEYNRPGRIFEPNAIREEVEQALADLDREVSKMQVKADEMEAVTLKLLQM